jgi:hypothetical protein
LVLNRRDFIPPKGCIWKCLEAFLVVISGHLKGRGCLQIYYNATNNYLVQNVIVPKLTNSKLEVVVALKEILKTKGYKC